MGAAPVGIAPALPLHEAGKYVAGAYIVLFVIVLAYVAIMAIRLSRIERVLGELLEDTDPRHDEAGESAAEDLEAIESSAPESTPV